VQFSVSVTIPADADGGALDETVITLISQGDPAKHAEARLRTTALAPGVFIPLVGR
jgi:hypothetical protein